MCFSWEEIHVVLCKIYCFVRNTIYIFNNFSRTLPNIGRYRSVVLHKRFFSFFVTLNWKFLSHNQLKCLEGWTRKYTYKKNEVNNVFYSSYILHFFSDFQQQFGYSFQTTLIQKLWLNTRWFYQCVYDVLSGSVFIKKIVFKKRNRKNMDEQVKWCLNICFFFCF